MLEAVKLFENDDVDKENDFIKEKPSLMPMQPPALPISITKTPLKEKKLNSTLVSEDIIQMCQMIEDSNAFSAKKDDRDSEKDGPENKRINKKPHRRRSSVHYRNLFGSDDDEISDKVIEPEKGIN